MARVKVLLEKGESELDADLALLKALSAHINGDTHLRESFEDPAMIHVSDHMEQLHDKMYDAMIREIIDELEKEYSE